jgi:glycosyltransferase involved in cell wall biosynthesis
MSKRRVLVCGEASWLSTGFAKFNNAILRGLHKTGKYELAEMGSYGSDSDPQVRSLPWKFYGVIPNNEEESRIYKGDQRNAFGRYKMDAVLLDFQPDIVFDARDPWMFEHIAGSKLRSNFRLCLMPTVDSAPQRKQWIDDIFKKADVLTTYSRFGAKVLKAEELIVTDVTSPAVNLDLFKPLNRELIRDKHQIVPDLFIFGTVMRNQKRKLFPDLFEAYVALRNKYRRPGRVGGPKGPKITEEMSKKVNHSVLLCHTSWPDVGWDIPELLYRYSIQRHVIFTYKCESCKKVFLSWFIPCDVKGMARCRICGEQAAHMPGTHTGVTEEELVEIYNLMDCYIQPAICEGWGLPITESKACGVPGLYQNYSAMEDHVENGGGMPIKVGRYYTEPETMAYRSLPDLDDFVKGMETMIFDDTKRLKMAKEAREVAEKSHRWEDTVKKLEDIFDKISIHNRESTWDRHPNFAFENHQRPPQGLSNEQFVAWCYLNILGRRPDPKGFEDWMKSLAGGSTRDNVENFFRSEIEHGNLIENERWTKSQRLRGIEVSKEENDTVSRLDGVLL